MTYIGPVLYTEDAIISTNGFSKDLVLFEWMPDTKYRHRIVLEVYGWNSDCVPMDPDPDEKATPLPHGICHTFEWRLEETFKDEYLDDEDYDEDDWELLEAVSALSPLELVQYFPDEIIDEIREGVSSWFEHFYPEMNTQVQ